MDNINKFKDIEDFNSSFLGDEKFFKGNFVSYIESEDRYIYAKKDNSYNSGIPDISGLSEIGWSVEDILNYNENGVNWDYENNSMHKLTPENKALFPFRSDNIPDSIDILEYSPYFDTNGFTGFRTMFRRCAKLKGIPMLDTSSAVDVAGMFSGCSSLIWVPDLDTRKVITFESMFLDCASLKECPNIDTSNATNMLSMFARCRSMSRVPYLNTSKNENFRDMFNCCDFLNEIPQIDTGNGLDFTGMFYEDENLVSIPDLDMGKAENDKNMFRGCYGLRNIGGLTGLKISIDLSYCNSLTEQSMVNIFKTISVVPAEYRNNICLGSDNLSRLSAEQKNIATRKGWTLV